MSTRSKLIVVAAIATLGLASPAFAQSFNRPDGTGNELPSYYDSQGGLHAGVAPVQQNLIAARRSGQTAFASAPPVAATLSIPGAGLVTNMARPLLLPTQCKTSEQTLKQSSFERRCRTRGSAEEGDDVKGGGLKPTPFWLAANKMFENDQW